MISISYIYVYIYIYDTRDFCCIQWVYVLWYIMYEARACVLKRTYTIWFSKERIKTNYYYYYFFFRCFIFFSFFFFFFSNATAISNLFRSPGPGFSRRLHDVLKQKICIEDLKEKLLNENGWLKEEKKEHVFSRMGRPSKLRTIVDNRHIIYL